MKLPLVIAGLALIASGCTQKKEADLSVQKKLIENHFKYLNAHDLKSLRTQYSERAYVTAPEDQGAQPGPLGADQIFHRIFLTSSNMQYMLSNVIVNDSSAFVRYEVRGSKTREAANTFFDYKGCSFFRISNAKIDTEIMFANPSKDISFMNGRMMMR